jgi:hypothetical protein
MHQPRRPAIPGATPLRVFLLLILAGLAAGVAACDSGTGPGNGGEELPDIEGTWAVTQDGYTLYLEITSTSMTEYYGVEGQCFFIGSYAIVGRSGDTVTLQPQGATVTFELVLRREGSGLRLIDPSSFDQSGVLLSESTQDLSSLTECPEGAGGTDPSIDCTMLPPITLGTPIDGDLSATDSEFFGSYYDLYGLTLDVTQEVTIDLTSDEIDSYLYLYDAGGTYITEDDDGGGGFNSSITETLDAGCYRVEASSWGADETGAYSLVVN